MFRLRQTLDARVLAPLMVFLAGLALAAAAGVWVQHTTRLAAGAEFERAVERAAREIERRFRTPVYGLNGARGTYAASGQLDRAAFAAYVESRDLGREFPGVRGFGLIEPVAREDLPGYLDTVRADGAPGFRMHSIDAGEPDHHYLIRYIEPQADNLGAAGLDIGSERQRREAALQAIDSGEAVITGPITLVQDNRRTPGVLLFVPVYRPGPPMRHARERNERLSGLLFAPIVIDELLAGLPDVALGQARVRLFDEAVADSAGVRIFDSAGMEAADPAPSRFSDRQALPVPGRMLVMQISSTPLFDAASASPLPWMVLAGGTLAAALLALLLQQQVSGRARAEALARRMTADLDRLALVARRTSNAVVITDAKRTITWVNDAFERITGHAAAGAVGSPLALLQFDASDAQTLARLDAALADGTPFDGVLLSQRRDGLPYWSETELQPLRDGAGALSGFILIESDISERKIAEGERQRMEADLRRNNELLTSVLENLPCGLSVFDREPEPGDRQQPASRSCSSFRPSCSTGRWCGSRT